MLEEVVSSDVRLHTQGNTLAVILEYLLMMSHDKSPLAHTGQDRGMPLPRRRGKAMRPYLGSAADEILRLFARNFQSPSESLPANGAVIFGHSWKFPLWWPSEAGMVLTVRGLV